MKDICWGFTMKTIDVGMCHENVKYIEIVKHLGFHKVGNHYVMEVLDLKVNGIIYALMLLWNMESCFLKFYINVY